MTQANQRSRFKTKLLRPLKPDGDSSWAFVVLPRVASERLPRRGRTTVVGKINGHRFTATLEPDGQRGHWLRVSKALQDTASATVGDVVALEIQPVEQEPEPEVPSDLEAALAAAPEARSVWRDITTIARLDWIHWITSAKQPKTRAKRIGDACDMLSSGKRQVCCFDPSGFYSKSFRAPETAD
ncbi:MAG: YdeI/OmpD-associated family protein [Casimicrobiaceae bacterium]